ncbi:allophanate hydrolase [Sneathiella litorea]|uniref:Allophanate hydrolase n=1 Tax=Sneathiella litorea TaxID=2606216 RepID=A0A6L8WDZ4_9PROT|nr:allophanate hydrolase [Sneathiella litorea]MZR32387.1 allophanate hydrolase [Sneathiella litorea]
MTDISFDINSLHRAYADGTHVSEIIAECYRRIEEAADPGIFLKLVDQDAAQGEAEKLGAFDPVTKPLWGIPFVVKDNIDVAGLPTSAACPAYEYDADADAFVVAQLREAGAILIGKTNLDQFATGLVGIRSPYPPPKNAIDPEIVPGGSSSGSGVAVALGLVSFSLGTDTAGSGRVPAALNNIVGLKPTLGALSASGVVPACRTLDTISIFALTVEDAYRAFQSASAYDPLDAYSRETPVNGLQEMRPGFRVGVPTVETREFFGDAVQSNSFDAALAAITALGGEIVEIDFTPFYDIANMLYEGAWVAERFTVIADLLRENPEAILPVTRAIVSKAESLSAADAFCGMYKLQELKRIIAPLINSVDIFCVPSIPTFYSLADLEEDPIGPNARLGTYTNFVNLLDLCGIAVPVTTRTDGRPGSVTLLAKAGKDAVVASLAALLHYRSGVLLGATNWTQPLPPQNNPVVSKDEICLAAVGAHMSGLPLNGELTKLGGRFLKDAKTAPIYRLYSLAGGPPYRPGLVRNKKGTMIDLEIWAIPVKEFGEFIRGIPAPLGIGTVSLSDGTAVNGFICEAAGLEGATDITNFGGWRKFLHAD